MSDTTQRLVLAIIDFLNTSIEDGTVKADDKESLEVAIQCIGEAFGVDPNAEEQRERLTIKPATLQSLFDVYVKTSAKIRSGGGGGPDTVQQPGTSTSPTAAQSSSIPTTSPTLPTPTVTDKDKKEAEALKGQGNSYMSAKKYDEAIEAYTKAVKLDPTNPVYFSNRAAAHSSVDDHESAIVDAKKAAELDPNFVKAYSRLGHAYYSKGDYGAAVQAFEDGLKVDPGNANLKTNLENAKTRLPALDRSTSPGVGAGGMPDFSALAGMFGGGGGSGGAGGMPDLASLLQNPALMQAAQNMMANGGLETLMQDPALQNMARNMNSGGGMPNMADLMNTPELANLASSFMGGAGAGGARPPPS